MEINGRSDRYRVHFVTREELLVTVETASNPKFIGGCSSPIRERIANRRQRYSLNDIWLHEMPEHPKRDGSSPNYT
jgi:hypothetical protein